MTKNTTKLDFEPGSFPPEAITAAGKAAGCATGKLYGKIGDFTMDFQLDFERWFKVHRSQPELLEYMAQGIGVCAEQLYRLQVECLTRRGEIIGDNKQEGAR